MSRDAEMAVVTLILKHHDDEKWEGFLRTLADFGLQITDSYNDRSIVEGVVALDKVHALEKFEFVNYVRKVSTYNADYPAGDPRDANQGLGGSPDDLPPEPFRRFGKRYP